MDTVRHHETGLMYHKEKKLADDVIRLLQDRKFLTGILAAEDKKQIIETVRQREKIYLND